MINFQILETNKDDLRLAFLLAKPFSHVVIDAFCEEEKLLQLHTELAGQYIICVRRQIGNRNSGYITITAVEGS